MTNILIILLFLALPFTSYAKASDDFETSIESTYIVSPQGITKVRHHFSITNKTTSLFVTEYSLNIGAQRIKHVEAKTASNRVIPVNHQLANNNETHITLQFPDQVVGKDKIRVFDIEYTNIDASSKQGNVLQVSIPSLETTHSKTIHTISLLVPVELGEPAIISPTPISIVADPVYRKLTFQQNSDNNEGISAIFGDKQTYAFTITYQLDNPTITPVETQIAFPPDTTYQQLIYENIHPSPKTMIRDGDGNWIATYTLNPKEQISIEASGYAVVYPKSTLSIPPASNDLNRYLEPQKYWEIHDPSIKQIANGLTDAKSIYTYLVNTFSYNHNRLQSLPAARLGAAKAISDPGNALCQEFTDTFIALARAKGIPTRLLLGYAASSTDALRPVSLVKDILHSWVEYYDTNQQQWLAIDPTWGQTTGLDYFSHLDFSHIVFAIQGSSSTEPYPAGYYKNGMSPTKHVHITVTDAQPNPKLSFAVDRLMIEKPFLTTTGKGELHIRSTSPVALYQPNIQISLSNNTTATLTTNSILLPQSHAKMPFTFTANNHEISNATITIEDTTTSSNIQQKAGTGIIAGYGIATIFLGIITFIAFKTGSLLVSKRKR